MLRDNLPDLLAFAEVARERSFTRAAARLGLSQSTLSHAIKGLEERLAVRLLTRTTRSVSPTDAGQRLLDSLAPRFEEIEAELAALTESRDKPAGTIRITTTDYAANTILWPRLATMLPQYPELRVELSIDYGLRDIVKERFDIGIRSGDQVAKDMIAVRVGPPYRTAMVAAPAYLERHPAPTDPQQLVEHRCINLRLPTYDSLLPWELGREGETINVRVEGQVIVLTVYQKLEAVLVGLGIATLPEDLALPYVQDGQLRWVMEAWFPTMPGLHAYYPSRRQSSRALQLVIDAIRYRG